MGKRGKRSDEKIAERRLGILRELLLRRSISEKEFLIFCKENYGVSDPRTILAGDIEELKSIGIPIDLTDGKVTIGAIGLEKFWEGEPKTAGGRLGKGKIEKQILANEVVAFLREKREKDEEKIQWLLLGTGTTIYEVTKKILANSGKLDVNHIYTTNLFVLHEFARQKTNPLKIRVEMASGELMIDTVSLYDDKGIEHLQGLKADAVITSFGGLHKNEFHSGMHGNYEIAEKVMNLRPQSQCKYVIIPMEWWKIGNRDQEVRSGEKKGYQLLTFPASKERKYVIIIDKSEEEAKQNKEKYDILEWWGGKNGVKVIYSERPEQV